MGLSVLALFGLAACAGQVTDPGGQAGPSGSEAGAAAPHVSGAGGNAGSGTAAGMGPAAAGAQGPAAGAGPASCEPPDAYIGPSLTLNDRQLQRTLQALFPFPLDLPPLPQRPRQAHAFSSGEVGNRFTLSQLTRWTEAAEAIAAQAHDHLDELLPCALSAQGESCAAAFIDDFAPRAFRRPLEADERSGLLGLYRELQADGVAPQVAVSAVIAAVLQSPQFLYQLDLGAPQRPQPQGDSEVRYALTDHELAARLAYLLTDSPPDPTLATLAHEGTLGDPAVLRQQATRLLDTPAGQEALKRFVREWFDIEGEDYSSRVDPQLASAMVEEIDRDLDAWMFGAGALPIGGLLSARTSSVNAALSDHYGLESDSASDSDWQTVQLPAHYRGGLLTKALVAARYSSLEEPSIILRGVFVLRDLMCMGLGNPPDNAVDLNPKLPAGALPREKSEARAEIQPCGSCHSLIDPIGLGMEELDQLGRYRTHYAGGQAVDNDGELYLLSSPQFVGTAELAQALAGSERFAECAGEQLFEHALGHPLDDAQCGARALIEGLSGEAGMRELLLSLVESEPFRFRRTGAAPGASP